VKYGYARGWEPVLYVNNIRSYYNILRWISASEPQEEEEVEPEASIEMASNN
jgi:membrane-bound lytic murein transglycosylase F